MNASHTIELVRDIVLAVILLISVITDLRTQKIYNWVTFPGMILGIVFNAVLSGGHGVLLSIEGIAVGMLWFLLILLGGSGFGDLKLIYTVGSFMGPSFMIMTLLYTVLAGGVLGVLFALKRGVLQHTIKNALLGAHVFAAVQSPEGMKGMVEQSKAGKMAYAPAIAIGVLIQWLLIHHII